jgi:hypothetical protein
MTMTGCVRIADLKSHLRKVRKEEMRKDLWTTRHDVALGIASKASGPRVAGV